MAEVTAEGPRASGQQRWRAVLEGLSAFPHRGSGTPLEAASADWLSGELSRLGFMVRRQPVRVPTVPSADLLGAALLIGAGAFLARQRPLLGAALAGLGTSWFDYQFSLRTHTLDAFVPKRLGANLLASFGNGDRQVILLAHYDTARSMYLYNPSRVRGFRQSFLANAVLAHLAPVVALAGRSRVGGLASGALGLYFLGNVAMLTHRELREPFVNGANDNASGVAAVVEAAVRLREERLPLRVTLALTSGEEVGSRGARALVASLKESNGEGTLVINVDNVGRGDVRVATGEGMLAYHPYHPDGVAAARVVNARRGTPAPELEYRLAYFDALPFAQAGIPALTLIALEDSLIPNWHWPTDTLDRVDPNAVERAAELVVELAREWAGVGQEQG
jgi:hypothetical protein